MAAILVFGPPGSGKTRYAHQLAQRYGASPVVDEWSPGQPIPPGTPLLLSLEPVFGLRCIPISRALREAGIPAPLAAAMEVAPMAPPPWRFNPAPGAAESFAEAMRRAAERDGAAEAEA